jgi:hypothetical protein
MSNYRDSIPDVRDGLTRLERIILYVLYETQKELGGRNVPSTMLYGRVVELIDVAEDEFRRALESALGKRPADR